VTHLFNVFNLAAKSAFGCAAPDPTAPLLKSPHKFKQNKDLFPAFILAKTALKPLK
jgi:hypothetical protein